MFKHNNLQITIGANKKVVDFLGITLDLRTAIFKPYKKLNSNLPHSQTCPQWSSKITQKIHYYEQVTVKADRNS